MGVMIKGGNQIQVRKDDFQQTVDGVTFAIKFISNPSFNMDICAVHELIDGDWIDVLDISTNVPADVAQAGSPEAFAENVVRPAVKSWLAARKLQQPTAMEKAAAIVGKWLPL